MLLQLIACVGKPGFDRREMAFFERFGALLPWNRHPGSDLSLPFRFDRHDPVAWDALVDVDEWAQPDSGQFSQSSGVAAAGFATRRAAFFCERSGHGGYHSH